jgi:hypothetical protein
VLQVSTAYGVLSDDVKRRKYDAGGYALLDQSDLQVEVDLASLGILTRAVAAIFSKMGELCNPPPPPLSLSLSLSLLVSRSLDGSRMLPPDQSRCFHRCLNLHNGALTLKTNNAVAWPSCVAKCRGPWFDVHDGAVVVQGCR